MNNGRVSCHKYTDEEKAFLREYVPGHSRKEIQEEFIRVFGWSITIEQVTGCIKRYKLNTGRTGYFHSESNQKSKVWKKGEYALGCEKSWFKKGNVPWNHKPIGSERISVDGYREIKVAEPNVFKLKHRVVYEAAHGSLSNDECICFRDGDPLNCDIDNLLLSNRRIHGIMNKSGMCKFVGEHKEVAMNIAKLQITRNDRRKVNGV